MMPMFKLLMISIEINRNWYLFKTYLLLLYLLLFNHIWLFNCFEYFYSILLPILYYEKSYKVNNAANENSSSVFM